MSARGKCFNSGQTGHQKSNCPQTRGGTGGSGQRSQGSAFQSHRNLNFDISNHYVDAKERECKAKPLFVKRPDPGTLGREVPLVSNHFRLKVSIQEANHYDFDIKFFGKKADLQKETQAVGGSREGQRFRRLRQSENRDIFNEFVKITREDLGFRSPVYDGEKNIYTSQVLSQEVFEKKVSVNLGGAEFEFLCKIQFANAIDIGGLEEYYTYGQQVPQEVIQVLEIILRHGSTTNRIPIRNSLYPKALSDGQMTSIGPNKFVSFGHYQAIAKTKVGPTLIIDRSATAFFKGGPLVQFVKNYNFDMRNLANELRQPGIKSEALKRELKGIRVYTTHLPYRKQYTIFEITSKSAVECEFDFTEVVNGVESVRRISVAEYFERNYGRKLQFPHYPCVIPQGGRVTYLPLELCEVFPDQPVPRAKITPENTGQMVRACGAQPPHERFQEIGLASVAVKRDNKDYLKEFQIEIDDKPVLVKGRVLEPPATKGLDKHFFNAVKLDNWCVVIFDSRVSQQDAKAFTDKLAKESRIMGLTMQPPKKIVIVAVGHGVVRKVFTRAKQECGSGLQMIMFIIPDSSPIYNDIKLAGDTQDGIVTQCLKASNCTRPKGGLFGNLLLKINAKLGGVNRVLLPLPNSPKDKPRILSDFGKFPVMILGADITHPAPGDKLSSSVAACVGSYDKEQFFYASSISVQEHHRFTSREVDAVETIQKLDEMLKELFNSYRNQNNRFPQHVVYYRDGISEGEFRSVLDYELRKLYEAARAVGFQKKPRVTFIVVQKRHHTRFRPRDRSDGDRKGNIKAGTVVDTRVVHPTDNDFYLCSHNGIQGTSRPTHYFVLHDDHSFSSDELQKLTYYLCYTYSRCATPISIPTPVMYAHLAAYRARNHIVAANVSAAPPPPGLESQEQRLAREQQFAAELNHSVQVNEILKSRLYYC